MDNPSPCPPSLTQARDAFLDHAQEACRSDRFDAERDADRLETIACRLVSVVDQLQPAFDRLDGARDALTYTGPNGRRRERSTWNRSLLCTLVADAFDDVLSRPAMAFLAAAVRAETAP